MSGRGRQGRGRGNSGRGGRGRGRGRYYEKYNTKMDVVSAIGVTRVHKIILEHVAQEIYSKGFDDLADDTEHADVRAKAVEWYHAYVFRRQSGKQHSTLKVDLKNEFTTGDDKCPKIVQSALHLMDKYSKTVIVSNMTPSEGSTFAQKGGKDAANKKDELFWKEKTCFNCQEKGHPATRCPNKKKDDDDDRSRSSKSSKTSKTNVNKLQKQIKKSFATLSEKIEELGN